MEKKRNMSYLKRNIKRHFYLVVPYLVLTVHLLHRCSASEGYFLARHLHSPHSVFDMLVFVTHFLETGRAYLHFTVGVWER